jgi:hypothetical protein
LGKPSQFCAGGCEEIGSIGRDPPFTEDLSAEAEESPLLVAVTRERLVKTQELEKA